METILLMVEVLKYQKRFVPITNVIINLVVGFASLIYFSFDRAIKNGPKT